MAGQDRATPEAAMKIEVRQGDISSFQADAIVVNLFDGVTAPGGATGAVDQAMGGAISDLIRQGDIRGKSGELTLVHTLGRLPAPRVVVAGLGKSSDFNLDKVRDLSANLARFLRRQRFKSAAVITHGAGIGGMEPEAFAAAIAEGTLLGLYRFLRHKKPPEEETGELETLTIVEFDGAKAPLLERGVERGRILAEATNACRDLANEPANYLTPTDLAAKAEELAREAGIECEVYGPDWLREKGMGGVLGVAAGSVQEPRFIVMRYKGAGEEPPLALVGKGITFDTGGISIKPAENMGEMKGDMTGAAAVVSAISAIARLKPRINVIAVAPCTENMPSGSATKPGDVLRTMSGKTIEVVNTDAEGRLVLSDALTFSREQGARAIIDVATLTGAISTTLGNVAMGAMTNDGPLLDKLRRAASTAGEKVWELPMYDEYKDLIRSDVADMKNSGGRQAGSITAAFLLKEFVEDTPWVHLDIAGVDNYDREKGVYVKGSSGIPVRTLVHLALQIAEEATPPK
jgi:leucyl aminopeptidase